MARIEGIRLRLERWSSWCQRRDAGALGYSRVNILAKRGVRGTSVGGVTASDQDMEAAETQDAVDSLRFTRPQLHDTLTWHYAKGYELHRVAGKMGRALSTIKRNLELADAALRIYFVAKAEERRKTWRNPS
jgi:Phage antitermination protein Q